MLSVTPNALFINFPYSLTFRIHPSQKSGSTSNGDILKTKRAFWGVKNMQKMQKQKELQEFRQFVDKRTKRQRKESLILC